MILTFHRRTSKPQDYTEPSAVAPGQLQIRVVNRTIDPALPRSVLIALSRVGLACRAMILRLKKAG